MEMMYSVLGYLHDFEVLELSSRAEILRGLKAVLVRAKAVDDDDHDLKIREMELLSVLTASSGLRSKVALVEEMADVRKSSTNGLELAEDVCDLPYPI